MSFTANDHDDETTERRTMPPPELLDRSAPASAGSLVLEALRGEEPITRHEGPRAEIAHLRARVERYAEEGDAARERSAAIELCRLLMSRETELDTAIAMAERALQIADDADLRSDLADLLTGIGEHVAGAAVLRISCDPTQPIATAQLLEQIAVLLARGGDPAGADAALEQAAALDPSQPLAFELLGAIGAWAVKAVPAETAAHAYLAAAERHDTLGDTESGVEDRLRAFEVATNDETIADAVFQALAMRGALDAADEALREHATSLAETNRYRARQVHLRRVTHALDELHAARALGALLDAGIIAEVDTDLGTIADRVVALAQLESIAGIRRKLQQKVGTIAAIVAQAKGTEAAAATLLQAVMHAANNRERADALAQLAVSTTPEVSAVLLAVASESYLSLGLSQHARRTAEDACLADPGCARAFSALARATIAAPDKDAAMAVESGSSTMLIRASICSGMAHAFEAVGEDELALTWTQRWLALQPGCPEAMHELVRRASKAYDADRVEDALGWVLSQPRPLDDMAGVFGEALELLAELDQKRAVALGRRALDMYGPRVPGLRGRLLALSERAGDASLAITLLERLVSSKVKDGRAVERLFDLAQRRADTGDWDGAAAELARAAVRGAHSRTLNEHLDVLDSEMQGAGATFGSDGLVSFVEARVHALGALLDGPEHAQLENLSMALRELGSVKWDLAHDLAGAEKSLFKAAQAAPQAGMLRYAHDMMTFAGSEVGLDAVIRRAATLGDPRRHAALLIDAANLAFAHKLSKRAMEIAASAIQIDPSRADAVAIVEKASDSTLDGVDTLDRIYTVLAQAALGCYGRRAAHYRGARQLERRGAVASALRHAIGAFEAVPSEGTAYVLMVRLSERLGDPSEAIAAIVRVAETNPPAIRATWLLRAASMAAPNDDGCRVRYDLLLRATTARPDMSTIEQVGTVIRQLLGHGDDVDIVSMRFERASLAALKKSDGPDGARAAVALARVAFSALTSHRMGLALLEKAIAADGDIDEYAAVVEHASAIANADADAARAFVQTLLGIVKQPYSSVGSALLKFGGRLAHALGDVHTRALLLVQAAKRASEDDELVCDADAAVREAGDPTLRSALDKAVSPDERVAALVRVAEARERQGVWDEALAALQLALQSTLLDAAQRESALSSMRRLLLLSGRTADVETLLSTELDREGLEPQTRVRIAADLSSLLSNRGDDKAALSTLQRVSHLVGKDKDVLVTMLRLARRTGDKRVQLEMLGRLVEMTPVEAARKTVQREMARLRDQIAEDDTSPPTVALSAAPTDEISTLEQLQAEAIERGDHAAVADILGKRAAEATDPMRKNTMRRHRAAILDQHLGQIDEARTELVSLLAETPGDIDAMHMLADLHERSGKPLLAATLWKQLSASPKLKQGRADAGLRAVRAYLDGGDAKAARAVLDSVASIAPRDAALELRAAIAREQGDIRTQAEALEQLANTVSLAPEKRAAALLDAAHLATTSGDENLALDRARRAVQVAPHSADAVLELRRLEYRVHGAGTPREAQFAIEELTRIAPELSREQLELQAFLLAEVLDVVQGRGAGLRELNKRHAELGNVPLIALGMAERLVRNKNYGSAIPLFEHALTGNLRGVRTRGRVALAASHAAMSAGQLDLASRMLDRAAAESDTRPIALRRKLEFVAKHGEPDAARRALDELIKQTTGVDKARFLLQLGRLVVATDRDEAMRMFGEAAPLAAADRALAAQIGDELARLKPKKQVDDVPSVSVEAVEWDDPVDSLGAIPIPLATHAAKPVPVEARPPVPPHPMPPKVEAIAEKRPSAPLRPQAPKIEPKPIEKPVVAEVQKPPPSAAPTITFASSPPPPPEPPPTAADEPTLSAQLTSGSYEAGDRLVQLYLAEAGDRTRDILAVRKQQASIRPGDRLALENLRKAALEDRNEDYARAIDHILRGFDPNAVALPPPPLSAVMTSSELVLALLFKPIEDPINEALSLTWDTGRYRRELSHYGLAGAIRVQPGAPTALGDAWGQIIRIFGATRTPLFHRRTPPNPLGAFTPLTTQIALLNPPAIVLSGDTQSDSAELFYTVGAAVPSAMSEYVLVRGLPEETLRTLLSALLAAFGPVGAQTKTDPAVARLGQDLWQVVTPRADRRLREIFADTTSTTYDVAVGNARRASARAGLFACGDLPTTLQMVVTEQGLSLDTPLMSRDGLARACAKHPAIADIVRLATRSEYAEARWHADPSIDPRKERAARPFRL